MESGSALKDVYNKELVNKIGRTLIEVDPTFDINKFEKTITPYLKPLALKERAELICDGLDQCLPKDFKTATETFIRSFGPESTEQEMYGMEPFYYMPFGIYVARNGASKKDFNQSMKALVAITKRFTSEFPIRTFVLKFQDETFKHIKKWAIDKNVHVRRLASEGIRPRLPWAEALPEFKKDPTRVIEILELLKEDPELYVRRSVANNINDIAKDNPEIAVEVLRRWNKIENPNTKWLVKHAARSLVKSGNKSILELLGYRKPKIEFSNFKINTPELKFGNPLHFGFTIESKSDQELMVDFVINYMKANGKLAPKVYKLTSKSVVEGETLSINKKQAFKPISTRKFHAGLHQIEIQINGERFGKLDFELIM